jgi:hypothetical protein
MERPAFAAAPARAKKLRASFVMPAPVAEVMREQFDFLLAHASDGCSDACPECARLRAVRELLCKPFR